MATARYVCARCTTYIRFDEADDQAYDNARAWYLRHVSSHVHTERCGVDRADGVEDERTFALAAPLPSR